MATRIKETEGYIYVTDPDCEKRGGMKQAIITLRVTKDKRGASLSLAAEDVGVMLFVPLEPFSDILRVVE